MRKNIIRKCGNDKQNRYSIIKTQVLRCLFFRYGNKTETEKSTPNFIFDVLLGNERQASSENTMTLEGNQPRSRTVKRSSTNLTALIKKLKHQT